MEAQTTSSSSPSVENKAVPSAASNGGNNDEACSFDCAICYESLTKPGPPLESFRFGKLLINVSHLPFLERENIYRHFSLTDQCFTDGRFDSDKIVATICGHIFHRGCIREWFFLKRLDNNPKCPFCNRRTIYEECRVLHPTQCAPYADNYDIAIDEEEELEDPFTANNETEYSDISGTSSSWPSDDDASLVYDGEVMVEADDFDEDDYYEQVPRMDEEEHPFQIEDVFHYPVVIDRKRGSSSIYDLMHLSTLLATFKGAQEVYHERKANFLDHLERSSDIVDDDESLLDHDSFIPLGYDFIKFCLSIWVSIWLLENTADLFREWRESKGNPSQKLKLGFLCYMFFGLWLFILPTPLW